MKIEIKSIFGNVLFEYDCEDNTIRKTLEQAIKSSANLSSADLSSANLDKRYIQIGCIGSVKRITTYCFDDDIIWCGCFVGDLEQFERQVKETHKDSQQYLKEYLGFINYIKVHLFRVYNYFFKKFFYVVERISNHWPVTYPKFKKTSYRYDIFSGTWRLSPEFGDAIPLWPFIK